MEKVIENLDNRIDILSEQMAVMNASLKQQNKTIDKLSNSFDKLSTFIEKTNANDKKIDKLFRMVENLDNNGTKNCPVNQNRINSLEHKMEKLTGYIATVSIAVLVQFIGFVLVVIEHHIHF